MFRDWFMNSGGYQDKYSFEGKEALYEYLDNLSDETGEDIDFDPIALCCEYTEYPTAWDAMEQYQPEDMPVEGEEGDDLVEIQAKNEAKALEWLQERTQVIEFENGIIIQNF